MLKNKIVNSKKMSSQVPVLINLCDEYGMKSIIFTNIDYTDYKKIKKHLQLIDKPIDRLSFRNTASPERPNTYVENISIVPSENFEVLKTYLGFPYSPATYTSDEYFINTILEEFYQQHKDTNVDYDCGVCLSDDDTNDDINNSNNDDNLYDYESDVDE